MTSLLDDVTDEVLQAVSGASEVEAEPEPEPEPELEPASGAGGGGVWIGGRQRRRTGPPPRHRWVTGSPAGWGSGELGLKAQTRSALRRQMSVEVGRARCLSGPLTRL